MKTAFLIFVILGFYSCAVAQTNESANARDQIRGLEKQYNEIIGHIGRRDRQLKSWPYRRQNIVSNLLDSCSNSAREMAFSYLADTSTTNWPSDFDDLLVQEFVRRFAASDDLPRLTLLLAARCPKYEGLRPIEFWLVDERGPDAIKVLTSAYFSSGANCSSKMLLECFQRAFPELKSKNMSDSAFVKACAHWTELNRAKLRLNYDYYLPDAAKPTHGPLFDISEDGTKTGASNGVTH
jgi:hypothetical protein